MSLYSLKQLLNDCSTRSSRTKCAADKKRETLEDVWRAFNDWIDSRFENGKGVHIATFGTISWETCTNARNQVKLRPVFILSDTYIKTYGLQQKKPFAAPILASCEDINFTKIAIKFSKNLTKDLVFCGIRDMLQKIGEVAATGCAVSITFNFGRLIAKNRCISMLFDPHKFPRSLEDQITRSMISSPPSVLGNLADFDVPPEDAVDYNMFGEEQRLSGKEKEAIDVLAFPCDDQEALPTSRTNPENVIAGMDLTLEEELQMFDALHSPRHFKEHPVTESAFKRHIAHLADEVDREAKHALDQHLQQQRDIEAVTNENRMRRLCAEELQRHLLMQMEGRQMQKYKEKQARQSIEPSSNSFYSESERTRMGYDDKAYLQRVKQELKHQLEEQIQAKEQGRMNDQQKNLQEDKLFLRRLKNEMEHLAQKQTQERDERRQVLTDAWQRHSAMKQLVEIKKKQKAIAQFQHVPPTKACTSYPKIGQSMLSPRCPRQTESDFSVGFDIRSVCE